MRRTALVLGFISLFLVTLSAIFKLLHWPGGGIGIILGNLVFCGGFQPALMAYVSKEPVPPIVKLSRTVSAFASVCLATGLLFGIQHWPGGTLLMMAGSVLSLVAIAVFLLSIRAGKDAQQKNLLFTVITLAVLVVMCLSAYNAGNNSAAMQKNVDAYLSAYSHNRQLQEQVSTAFSQLDKTDSAGFARAEQLQRESESLLRFIRDVRRDIVSMTMAQPPQLIDTLKPVFYNRWDDIAIPTYFLIGESPEQPTGKGTELLKRLRSFSKTVQMPLTSFTADLPAAEGDDAAWLKAHFYHKTMVECLQQLLDLETGILEAVKKSLGQAA